MKKSLLWIVVLILSISMVAAFSEVAPAEEAPVELEGKIEFMVWAGVDEALFKVLEELNAEFQKANPGVVIDMPPAGLDFEGEIRTRLASGNIPDIWSTHGWSVIRYGSFLLPLENESWAANLNPALKPVMVDANGHLYAFPIDLDTAGILYNEDVLTKAGFKAADIKTWDDFKSACDAVVALGKIPIFVTGKDRWTVGAFVDWIIPGIMTNDTCSDLLSGTFTPDEWTKDLELVAGFRDAGYFNPDYSSATLDGAALALASGDTAFCFMMNFVAVAAYEYNPDCNVKFMPVPAFSDGGEPYLIIGEHGAIGIWKDSESVDACKAYVAYLAEDENLKKLATSTGSMAGLTTVTVDLGRLQSSYELTKTVVTVPYFDRVYLPSGAWDSIVSTTEGVVTNQMTIKEAVAKMSETYVSLYTQQHKK